MSSQAGGGIASYLPLIIMVAAFWLLVLRPQQQRAKQQRELISQLEVGDKVVTIGGIYATIVEVGDERLIVEVVDGSRMELARRAVGSVLAPDEESDQEPEPSPDGTSDVDAIVPDGDDS